MPMSHAVRTAAALLAAVLGGGAQAVTTCSATMTDISFGAVDPLGGLVDATATINYQCTYSSGLLGNLYGVYARLCLSIGTGAQGTGIAPRQMTNTSGDVMAFQLYRDAGHSQTWGSIDTPGTPPLQRDLSFTILGVGTTRTGSATVYGRVPAGQTGLGIGSYANAFSGIHTRLSFRYNEVLLSLGTYPADCGTANNGTFAFTANANVAPACTVSAADHDFGPVDGLLGVAHDAASAISLRCTYRAPWQVSLGNGQNASGTARRMSGAGGLITYELYRDIARSQRWGSSLGIDTLAGTGTGTTQNLTVYGRVPAQAPRAAGLYTDTIVVTVTY
ncbi:Csu type fimbrial protein [Dokdonella koreensis]|uniref:Spore Coat Protein U domain protein n=1 Tax=Dokdonella koreensis DS-123 TaxID=1300342 RepID=A0A167HB00_9GAMM|nr:spore coat U domain-containing protein [Dokdonella koreensis]ANB19755.1 Spore Coat Protein U domain protein [Dokdonella koreensis DS-123]